MTASRLLALGRQHDDRDVLRARVGAQTPADLEAVDAGQHQVEHDEVGQLAARLGQTGLAVGGRDDVVVLAREMVPDELDEVGFVVDHEDAGLLHAWRP